MQRIKASPNYAIIGLYTVLAPVRRQAIIRTNTGLLSNWLLKTYLKIEKQKYDNSQWRKWIWKWRLQNKDHFVSASICLLGRIIWALAESIWCCRTLRATRWKKLTHVLHFTKCLRYAWFTSVISNMLRFWWTSHRSYSNSFTGYEWNDSHTRVMNVHKKGIVCQKQENNTFWAVQFSRKTNMTFYCLLRDRCSEDC